MATIRSRTDREPAPQPRPGESATRPLEIIVSICGERSSPGVNPHEAHFEALRATLEEIGTVRVLANPESRLAFAAHKAEKRGCQPIHLAFGEPHEIYLTPTVPTVVVPLWGYPDIPTTDLARNTRQNWARIVSRADALVVAAQATQTAFLEAGVETPVHVLESAIAPELAALPVHDGRPVRITCRHEVRGGPKPIAQVVESVEPIEIPSHIKPHAAHRPYVRALPRRARQLAVHTVKKSYDKLVRRWLSQEAHDRLRGLKRSLLRQPIPAAQPAAAAGSPPLPDRSTLTLNGLTFLAEIDYCDPGVNDIDLITAYLIAYRTRPDVTLVVRLATTPEREPHDLWRICHHYEMLRISHECRIVFVSEPLDHEARFTLMRGARFAVDTRRSAREAWFLTSALAAGRPVISARHSALTDRVATSHAFIVGSSQEPAAWPQNPEARRESFAHRLDWADLRNHLVRAGALSDAEYQRLSHSARDGARKLSDKPELIHEWRTVLANVASRSRSAFDWAS